MVFLFDIIVCGSNTVDAYIKAQVETIERAGKTLIALPAGEKIKAEELEFHIGGGGTNALATFRAQGLSCGYIGGLGRDGNGHKVYEWLREHDVEFLGQVGGETGYAVIIEPEGVDRTILVHKGANNEIIYDNLPTHKLLARWFYGGALRGESHKTLEKLFSFMKSHGSKTAYNPNNIVAREGIESLKKILKNVDVLILNTDEARALVGAKKPLVLARELSALGPSIVAITAGREGVMVLSEEECFSIRRDRAVEPVDTTGAGDAFASGLVAALAREESIRDAALAAILNAEEAIKHYGTKSVLAKKALDRQLAQEKKSPNHTIKTL